MDLTFWTVMDLIQDIILALLPLIFAAIGKIRSLRQEQSLQERIINFDYMNLNFSYFIIKI